MPGFDQTTQPPGVGRVLAGRYRLIAPIARGGMAEVWEGHDEVLTRPVAVKVLQAHLAADGIFLERFRREAVTAARLAHPGIVATFDTGLDQGTAFIVMELVRGRNLRQILNDYGRLAPWQTVAVARQVADALAYAHQSGLVHRDIKPANVLLVEDEWGAMRVKVTDFGIAKAGLESGQDLTRTGMVLGTPKYLSPEQIRGIDPDPRADLYSLGVVMYEMLVGAPPFMGETDMATALAHLSEKVPKPSSSVRDVPGGLDRIVVDLLAKSPDRRIQSAADLRGRLDSLGPLGPPGRSKGAGSRRDRRRKGGAVTGGPGAVVSGDSAWVEGSAATTAFNGAGAHWSADPIGASSPTPGVAPGGLGPVSGGAGAPTTARMPADGSFGSAGPVGRVGPVGPVGPVGSPTGTFATGPPPPPPASTGGFVPLSASGALPDMTVAAPVGSPTDQFGSLQPAPGGPPRPSRPGRRAGFVVLGLLVVAGLVAAGLLATRGDGHGATKGGTPGGGAGPAVAISSVSVYMVNGRPPDNPQQTPYTFDGNPSTYWQTDQYSNATFGNLYPGIGLSIELAAPATLHSLSVTSPTSGWTASVYVSDTAVSSGQPVSAWGQPVETRSGITGDVTFSLGGRHGRYVLLWITNLGPAHTARVSELVVK